MKHIWTEEEAAFHGEFGDFDPIGQGPKPVQHPHVRVLVGGEGPRVLERVLAYGDEWAPTAEPGLEGRVAELPRLAAAGSGTWPGADPRHRIPRGARPGGDRRVRGGGRHPLPVDAAAR